MQDPDTNPTMSHTATRRGSPFTLLTTVGERPRFSTERDPELDEAVGLQEEDGVFRLEDTPSYGVIKL